MKRLCQLIGVAAFWLSWPGLWLMLHGTRRTRVIIMYKNQEILLVKGWLGAGDWLLPGGGLHKGESSIEGVLRETTEETGVRLLPEQVQFVGEKSVKEYGISYTAVVFQVELNSKPETKPQKLEISDLTWQYKTRLENLSPATRQILGS